MFHIMHVEFPSPAAGVFRFIFECFAIRDPEASISKTQKEIHLKYELLWVSDEISDEEGEIEDIILE